MSDLGYGHASRAIALIRELRSLSPKLSISVRTLVPASYIRNSLSPLHIEVTESANDIDLRFNAGLYCDLGHAYKENIEKFPGRLQALLQEERRFCTRRGVDLIISDIAAYPFYLASGLGIPSTAVASFLWSWFLGKLLDVRDPQVKEVVERMDQFYGLATRSFALPFSSDLSSLRNVRQVSLLVKKLTRSPPQIREALGYGENDFLVFFTGGFTLPWPAIVKKLLGIPPKSGRLKIILSSNAPIPESENVKRIPQSDLETQDYVAASNLVVSKPGHSIVSEAVVYRVPLILTLPTEHPEWRSNLEQLTSKGVATPMPFSEFEELSWLRHVEELSEAFKDQRERQSAYSGDGGLEIASSLIEEYNLR